MKQIVTLLACTILVSCQTTGNQDCDCILDIEYAEQHDRPAIQPIQRSLFSCSTYNECVDICMNISNRKSVSWSHCQIIDNTNQVVTHIFPK